MNNLDQPRTERPESTGEISIGELIDILWNGRFLVLGTLVGVLLLGVYYVWRKTPIYQVNAMLQVEDKKGGKGGPGMEALSSLLDQPTLAQAEIEIIKSNMVLGRTVESLSLDVIAVPDFNLFIGDALVRQRSDAPGLRIERFEVPAHLKGARFHVIAESNGRFRWEAPDGSLLAAGLEGEDLKVVWQGQPLELQVRRLVAPPRQRFSLIRQPLLRAIEELRRDFQVMEKGKQTNIIGLTYEHRSPVRGAEILNEIVYHYVRQNIERKAEEASKTLAFLQEQLPQLRAKLDAAENQLNQFRMQSGSVDLSEEAKSLLTRSVDINGQMLVMKQKKLELLRTYKEDADVVMTLNQQVAKLQKESEILDVKVKGLPRTQQEVVRLTRDVQVNNELYTALLNNVQQLQVAKAGEIGNARIVDHAMPSLGPIKPQKVTVMGLSALLGVLLGVGLTMLKRALNQGVEDPRIIESQLGLPVVVTIPHSSMQAELSKKAQRQEDGLHLLATNHPEDMAVESLRSLRTSLHFTMMDATNKVIMVAGPSPSIGKSFVSANFAIVLAQAGQRVLLVDCDLRRGRLHEQFGLGGRKNGLSDVLVGDLPWREVVRDTGVPGLDAIFTGTLPPNPSELLMSSRFANFVKECSQAYDLVLMDAPPVLAVTDASIIGAHVGTVLLLAKSKAHALDEIRTTLQRLESSGVKPKGCIFNDVVAIKVGYGYYRYAYHYGYKK